MSDIEIDELIQLPKRHKIPTATFKPKSTSEVDFESTEEASSSSIGLEDVIDTSKSAYKVASGLLPDISIDQKKARLKQYKRRPLPIDGLGQSTLPEQVGIDKMSEKKIDAQLEMYESVYNAQTNSMITENILRFCTSQIDSFTSLKGEYVKKNMEDETLKADLEDELSVITYMLSRRVRIIARVCQNWFSAFTESVKASSIPQKSQNPLEVQVIPVIQPLVESK